MKNLKILLTFTIILITLLLSSCKKDNNPIENEEVTSDWFYKVGQQRVINYADNPFEITEPDVGENMEWDFSNAIGNSKDTISIVNPQGLTFADSFPQANLASISSRFMGNTFYESTSDSIAIIGGAISASLFIKYENPNIIHTAPFCFGDIINESYIFIGDTAQGLDKASKIIEFAGTGTVITPEKTFEDCIMYKQSRFNDNGELVFIDYSFYQGSFINQIAYYQLNYYNMPIDISFSWGSEI